MNMLRSPGESRIPVHWKLMGSNMTARGLYYHPAVFFSHHHLIALSIPQGKIWFAFQKHNLAFSYIFKNINSEIA
jgi:hypothetical protein